jgi:hypothetical protein
MHPVFQEVVMGRSVLTAAMAAAISAGLMATALAEPVAIAPVAISQELQAEFDDTYGAREADYLKTDVLNRLGRELQAQGFTLNEAGPLRIAVTIEAAKPNRPTFEQLRAKPGLDYARSFGVGGASLSATISRPGQADQAVRYRWFETDIEFAPYRSTWSDAQRAVRRFSAEVAKAAKADAAAPAS